MNPYQRCALLNQIDDLLSESLRQVRDCERAHCRQRRLRRYLLALILCGLFVLGLLLFTSPASAQGLGQSTPSYVDALATQIVIERQATASAWQQQSNAAQANADAVALEAQAAQARAQAVAQAQAATQQAITQQLQAQAAQSTSDAAAQRATAVAQQTRDALSLYATQQAMDLNARATRSAIDVQSRNAQLLATQIAVSVRSTTEAKALELHNIAVQAEREQAVKTGFSYALLILIAIITLSGVLLLIKIFWATWRSRALNPQPIAHPTPNVSDAARTVVDATTGAVTRYVPIERDDDPAHLAELLRTLYGDVEA